MSAIGLGCMNLSHGYGAAPDTAEAVALLHLALDRGVTFLDTAALYGGGANERLLSRIMHRRADFTLASKCVLDLRDGRRVLDGSPAAITATLDALVPANRLVGARYPAAAQAQIDTELLPDEPLASA